jgi:glycosyltransferase involved in cell wall biosynthesis
MSQVPRVSVVIATYNRANFLPETIESVLQQNFQDFELIVVDDGSTDGTRTLLQSYPSRVSFLYQDNRGPSAARNLGVRHARAPWIAFQDSDDLSKRDHLAALYAYANEHPDCGMVFANGAYLGGPFRNRGPSFRRQSRGDWPMMACGWSICSKRVLCACRLTWSVKKPTWPSVATTSRYAFAWIWICRSSFLCATLWPISTASFSCTGGTEATSAETKSCV